MGMGMGCRHDAAIIFSNCEIVPNSTEVRQSVVLPSVVPAEFATDPERVHVLYYFM